MVNQKPGEQTDKITPKREDKLPQVDVELVRLMQMQYANPSYAIVKKVKNAKGGENLAVGFFDALDRPIVNLILSKEDALDIGMSISSLAQE